jgi:hypothetical protein
MLTGKGRLCSSLLVAVVVALSPRAAPSLITTSPSGEALRA